MGFVGREAAEIDKGGDTADGSLRGAVVIHDLRVRANVMGFPDIINIDGFTADCRHPQRLANLLRKIGGIDNN